MSETIVIEQESSPHSTAPRPTKRLRTSKACIHCKTRKIRCEFEASSGPEDVCKRCSKYGLNCHAFPLDKSGQASISPPQADDRNHSRTDNPRSPLTRTSPIPVRLDRHARSYSRSSSTPPPPTTLTTAVSAEGQGQYPMEKKGGRNISDLPLQSGLRQLLEDRVKGSHFYKPDPRLLGSTSVGGLLTPISRDDGHSGQVFNHDMRFGARRRDTGHEESTVIWCLNGSSPVWRLPSHRLERPIVDKLLDVYARQIAPLHPILFPHEVRNVRSLSAFQILTMCSVASLSRDVPRAVCTAFRSRLYHLLEGVPGGNIWTSNQTNLSALLIMSMSAELHGMTAYTGGSIAFLRSGVAIRMALDLGLHRRVHDFGISKGQQRVRSRLWALCNIVDGWYALYYGQPMMIDPTAIDCEPFKPNESDTGEVLQSSQLVYYLSTLTVYVRKTLRHVYDVTKGSLGAVTNDGLLEIYDGLQHWDESLPLHLRLTPASTKQASTAGMIALMSDMVKYIFYRPIRYAARLPNGVTFALPDKAWQTLVARSRVTIAWFAENGAEMIDSWFIVVYCLACSAQLHFYNYLDTHDQASLHSLSSIVETMDAWSSAQGDTLEATSFRYRVLDIVTQLYQAASEGCENTRIHHTSINGCSLEALSQAALDPSSVPENTLDESSFFVDSGETSNLSMKDDWATLLNDMGFIPNGGSDPWNGQFYNYNSFP